MPSKKGIYRLFTFEFPPHQVRVLVRGFLSILNSMCLGLKSSSLGKNIFIKVGRPESGLPGIYLRCLTSKSIIYIKINVYWCDKL